MSQLYKIGLQNFQVFKEMTEFDLAPLTILTGANSSGKSSLIKALLLIGDNVKNKSFYKLDFTRTQHARDSFQEAINRKCDKENIVFRFYLNYPFQDLCKNAISSENKSTNVSLSSDIEAKKVIIEVSYKENNNNGILSSLSIYVQDDKNKTTLILVETDRKDKIHRLKINLKWFTNNFETIQSFGDVTNIEKKVPINDFNENSLITFNIPHSKSIEESIEDYAEFPIQKIDEMKYILNYFFANQDTYPKNILNKIERFIHYGLLKEIGDHFENTEYVEPMETKLRRTYTHNSQTTLLNEILLDCNYVQLNLQAEAFLQKWLKEFKIADDVQFEKIDGDITTQIIFYKNGDKYSLSDLGDGVTQYLSLLLKIALQITTENSSNRIRTPLKKTIILEKPETSFHPKWQSRLADMIVDALKSFEIKFIIETHSEYFIRRLQILTAEKQIKSQKVALYYFYEPYKIQQGRKQVEKINILPDGNLDNDFDNGFFDEATNMKFELLKLKIKKSNKYKVPNH